MSKRVKNIEHVIDHTTGEILTTSKEFTISTTTEDFFFVFLSYLGMLYELKNALDIHVLAFMMENVQFNKNIVSLTIAKRKELIAKIGVSKQNLSHSLKRLKEKGLVSGEDGDFFVNPELMWRGSTKERDKLLQEKGIDVRIKFKK